MIRISATAKTEVISLAAVIDKCRDGSAPWLRDIRPFGREQIREHIYQAVFGSANGDPQLGAANAALYLYVDHRWITLGALRQDLFDIIEYMVDEMTDPVVSPVRTEEQPTSQEVQVSADDMQSSTHQATPILQSAARDSVSASTYEAMPAPLETRPLDGGQVEDSNVLHRPHILSPAEVQEKRYASRRAGRHETAQQTQPTSSRILKPSPGNEVVPYHHQLVNAESRPLPTHVPRQPFFPAPIHHSGQMPMQQWIPQGSGPLAHNPGIHGMPPMPGFAYYVPYPMVPQMHAGFPMYGQPQYPGAFIQSPVPQQHYTAPQGYASVAFPGVIAGSRSSSVPESIQPGSNYQRQHQETQRASAAYHNAANSRNAEWSNRFGRPGSVQPSLPTLPYRPGCDDMFPQNAVEGASVKFQELTRNGQPSYAMATSREITPFAETARNTRPAGWGVVKIGNVS